MSELVGATQLRARLKAIKLSFKPIGRKWAETTVNEMRPDAPRKTGKGVRTIRVRNASMTRATVSAVYYMSILDKGSQAHDITPRRGKLLRFEAKGRVVFARRTHIPARSGMHFASKAANEALRQNPMAEVLIDQWNKAA